MTNIQLDQCFDDYTDCYRIDGDSLLVWAGDNEGYLATIPQGMTVSQVLYDPVSDANESYLMSPPVSYKLVSTTPSSPDQLATTGVDGTQGVGLLICAVILITAGSIWAWQNRGGGPRT